MKNKSLYEWAKIKNMYIYILSRKNNKNFFLFFSFFNISDIIVAVYSLNHIQLFVTPWNVVF